MYKLRNLRWKSNILAQQLRPKILHLIAPILPIAHFFSNLNVSHSMFYHHSAKRKPQFLSHFLSSLTCFLEKSL
ncbi:hypothetical protein Csa_023686 [Cucumis sativus]|nr:hypothetical protein Csa_023686 [Cucumis sativus]